MVGDMSETILDSNGDTLSLQALIQELSSFNVVFAGEEHDSPQAHEAELALLESLYAGDSSLVIALEMFERDAQNVLDSYLAGEITEDSFLASSRPWPNYTTDYRPLVEFARQHGVPVIAANVPRRAAAAAVRSGEVSSDALGADSVYMPRALHLDSDEYYARFAATMQGMSHTSPMGGMSVDALYKAQVLKDAVMAESIENRLGRKVLFFCGRFHCDYHLGIPYQLSRNHPELKVAVVTLMPAAEELMSPDASRIADFRWVFPQPGEVN